jgi:hypothetical protein
MGSGGGDEDDVDGDGDEVTMGGVDMPLSKERLCILRDPQSAKPAP